jgi:DNA-directed RNA polymerase subunit RPC12/RpoP
MSISSRLFKSREAKEKQTEAEQPAEKKDLNDFWNPFVPVDTNFTCAACGHKWTAPLSLSNPMPQSCPKCRSQFS